MCILSPLLELCKCSSTQICPFCQISAIIGIAFLSVILGYSLGKRKRDKPAKK